MGLFDWLSQGIGGGGSSILGGPMGEAGDTSSMSMPPPMSAPMPPVQPLDLPNYDQDPMTSGSPAPPSAPSAPPVPPPNVTDIAGGMQGAPAPPLDPLKTDIAAGMQSGQGGARGTPPLPVPTPAPAPATTPPVPPGAPMDIRPPPPPDSGPEARSFIGRALGLDPNKDRQLTGSLAAGLTAAGNAGTKGKFAAAASGAGAAITGGDTADEKTVTDQQKALTLKQASKKSEGEQTLNLARTQLALAQAKQAMAGGKDSVMNSQQQLYLRAQGLVNNSPEVKLAKSTYDNALKNYEPDSPQVKAAAKAHADLVAAKTAEHMTALGVDPKTAASIAKQPGMSQDNPVPKAGLTQAKFEKLTPGAWFVNPKDGKLLQKKGASPQQQQPGQVPNTSGAGAYMSAAPPPVPITAPAGSHAAGEDDDE